MRLIDEFVNRVLTDEDSFVLTDKKEGNKNFKYIQFMQCKVGNGRYVYAFYGWNPDFNTEFKNEAELMAIVADGTVYTIQDYLFNIWRDEDRKCLPKHHKSFYAAKKEKNEYVKNVLFKDFYNSLKVIPVEGEGKLKWCQEKARENILTKGSVVDEITISDMFNEQEIAKSLCGLLDFKKEALQHFEAARDTWLETKAEREKIKELVNASAGVESWEVEISEGLRSVDAVNVSVEFEVNDNKAQGKMKPERIIRKLVECSYFSDYDFATCAQGKEIFKALGVDEGWRSKNHLKCEHISKITYGRKELYVKTK